jgi:putative transposase
MSVLKIIQNAFGERAVLKLMFGTLIRAAERWKSIKVTDFECRQLSAIKNELDQEYEFHVTLNRKPSKAAAQTKISSGSQTSPARELICGAVSRLPSL